MVRGQFSSGAIKLGVAIFREAIIRRTIFFGGNCCPGGGQLSWGHHPGGNYEDGKFPRGQLSQNQLLCYNFHVAIFL